MKNKQESKLLFKNRFTFQLKAKSKAAFVAVILVFLLLVKLEILFQFLSNSSIELAKMKQNSFIKFSKVSKMLRNCNVIKGKNNLRYSSTFFTTAFVIVPEESKGQSLFRYNINLHSNIAHYNLFWDSKRHLSDRRGSYSAYLTKPLLFQPTQYISYLRKECESRKIKTFRRTKKIEGVDENSKKAVRTEKVKKLRLDRLLANRGHGTRSQVSAMIKKGKVKTYDNEEIYKNPSLHVEENIKLMVDGNVSIPVPLLVAYYKPIGVHSTYGDPLNRTNLLDALPQHLAMMKNLHPVGRLDADTSGLLLFSTNGQLTQTLLHPSNRIEREYEVEVENPIDTEEKATQLIRKLAEGVETSDGVFPGTITKLFYNTTKIDDTKRIYNSYLLHLKVEEGKYRMVRRILNNAGYPVKKLHRFRYGKVILNRKKKIGETECDAQDKSESDNRSTISLSEGEFYCIYDEIDILSWAENLIH